MICRKCGKEFDPDYDFIEEVELLEALIYFGNIEDLCPKCAYILSEELTEYMSNFKGS